MFFRKRHRVAEFLDTVVGRLLSEDRIFIYGDFVSEYQNIHNGGEVMADDHSQGPDPGSVNDGILINRFIGTLLWLVKYRVLSNMFNSPRRQAYLDLNFDFAIPELIDKYFNFYDTEVIKQTYDEMDLNCKKAYTGEMQKGDKPRFLVSPIWARNPDPRPFRVAARLFVESTGTGSDRNWKEDEIEPLLDHLEERFTVMSNHAAEAARKVNLV